MNEQRRCSTYIYIYIYTTEYYSTIKMNRIRPFEGTWMELEMIMLHKVSQTEKDKYDITYMSKYDINEPTYL